MSTATRTPHRVREPYGTIIDAVNDRDREFFTEHPRESAYLRPYVPGEYSPDSMAAIGMVPPKLGSWVLVRNVAPGIRTRRPLGHIASAGPVGGRMTIVSEDGVIASAVLVIGWEVGR
jgi:hypothetical protein